MVDIVDQLQFHHPEMEIVVLSNNVLSVFLSGLLSEKCYLHGKALVGT